MKIKNLISLGVSCGSLFFMNGLQLRTPGPVDNLGGDNLCSCIKLLNGSFYKSIIDNTYYFTNDNIHDVYEVCHFDGFYMIHNDFHLSKTKNELIKRYNNLLKYLEEAKTDKEMFFILSHISDDQFLSKDDMNYLINNIPLYIKNRLIIIGENWDECGINTNKYPLIDNYPLYSVDISILRNINTNILKNDFNNWWNINKHFYEERNKCNYDLL